MLCGKSVFSLLVRDAAARCSHVTRVDGHFRWRSAPAPAQFAYGGDDSFVRRSGGKEGGEKLLEGKGLLFWCFGLQRRQEEKALACGGVFGCCPLVTSEQHKGSKNEYLCNSGLTGSRCRHLDSTGSPLRLGKPRLRSGWMGPDNRYTGIRLRCVV